MATPPESCSKPRPSAFRKTGLHPCVFKPQTTRRLGARSHAPSPDPFKTPKKLGCGMVFKPHSCFLEQMLAMLRYPMRSSRKRSVEPSRTTCLGVPGRPGTVSTRAWQLRQNRAPNLGQVHSAKRACHPCVFKPQTTRRWEPRHTHPPQTPSKHQKNWGAAWCLSPIRVF